MTIHGDPKEIADLVLALQGQQPIKAILTVDDELTVQKAIDDMRKACAENT